jgi:hypothetical protein
LRETQYLSQALIRLRAVFRGATGVELVDTELAMMAGLDNAECRILLGVLEETGAIERSRTRAFVCRPSSWWASMPVRPPTGRGSRVSDSRAAGTLLRPELPAAECRADNGITDCHSRREIEGART